MFLPRFPADDFVDVGAHDGEAFNAEFDDILKGIDILIGPDQTDDHSPGQDVSAWDEQTHPIVSPTVGPRGETGSNGSQSEVHSSSLPSTPLSSILHPSTLLPSTPLPPLPPLIPPRTKKKSTVSRAWNKLKKVLVKKFGGGNQAPPKLSDKLVPERDDGVGRYESLFPKPAMTRK